MEVEVSFETRRDFAGQNREKKALPRGLGLIFYHSFFARAKGLAMRKTAFKFRIRVNAGGHNNTELNPVFRGMVFAGLD